MLARSFRRDERGNIAIMAAFAILAFASLAGGAVDLNRRQTVQQQLQDRMDAALLAGARALSLGADDPAGVANAQFTSGAGSSAGAAFRVDSGRVVGEASAEVPTSFLGLVGVNALTARAQGSAAAKGATGMELVLVLDVSGSMRGSGKIEALRTASVALVDHIYGDKETIDGLKVAIVPFSGRVNIAEYGATWMSDPEAAAASVAEVKLCTALRSEPNEWTDATPADEPFGDFEGNAKFCAGPALIALTSAKTPIRTALAALYPGDGTSTQVGMAWGWRAISPRWRGLWGDPASPLAHGAGAEKVVVIMTDGKNHPEQSGDRFGEAEANARLLRTCEIMRNEGVQIYAVTFRMGDTLVDLYQQCTGDPERTFNADSNDALLTSFAAIGESITGGPVRLLR